MAWMNGSRKRASVSDKEEVNQVTSTSNLVEGKKNRSLQVWSHSSYLTIQCSSKFIPNGGKFVIGKGRNSYKHENCMITTSAAQYVYQEKINYFGAQWFFVCIVLTLLWACCSLVMKVDKGLIYLFIYLFMFYSFIVLMFWIGDVRLTMPFQLLN